MDELQRLRVLVAAAVEQVEEAIAFREVLRPSEADEALLSRLDATFAANAFNLIRWSLAAHAMFCCARLWDTSRQAKGKVEGQSALSFHQIRTELLKPAVLDAIEARHATGKATMGAGGHHFDGQFYASLEGLSEQHPEAVPIFVHHRQRSIVEAGANGRLAAEKLVADIGAASSELKDDLDEIARWRNGRGAHRQVHPDPTNAGIMFPSNDALDRVLERTARLAHDAFFVAEYEHGSLDEAPSIWSRYSQAFWRIVTRPPRERAD